MFLVQYMVITYAIAYSIEYNVSSHKGRVNR